MAANNKSSIVNEHNTNQNEATAGRQDKTFEELSRSKANLDLTVLNLPLPEPVENLPEAEISHPVPTIVVTPSTPPSASEVDFDNHKHPANSRSIEQNQTFPCLSHRSPEISNISCPEIGYVSENKLDKSLLCIPKHERCNEYKASRPPSVDQTYISSKCEIDRINEAEAPDNDMEVGYNCSSTPIKEMNRQDNKLEDTECSTMSIDAPSPIAKDSAASRMCGDSSTPRLILPGNNSCDITKNSFYTQNTAFLSPHDNSSAQRTSQHVDTPRPTFEVGRSSRLPQSETKHHVNNYSIAGKSPDQDLGKVYHQQMMADYYSQGPSSESSWTDMSYRSPDMSIPPLMSDSCYQSSGGMDSDYFVYPSIYVSSAGLISVLLRNDMSVEMTVDRTIRVVSHNHMMAVATDSRGTAACLYHPAAKVFQVGPTTDIATDDFRARMGSGECILFSNGVHYFKLEDSDLQPTAPVKFSDISRDQSVNMLFSSEGYGESLVASCMQVASQAEYSNLPKGGVIVRINGVKVTQTGGGDVSVVTGAKFIRLSPHFGTARLGNRFVDIEIEKDWTVRLTKGSHSFMSTRKCAMVCNGKMEAGFDENSSLKAANLVPRHPLLAEGGFMRRPPPRKPTRFLGPFAPMPKRKPDPSGMGRPGRMFSR